MAISTRKALLAILSGTMLTAAFPPGKLDWMAWFAMVPLLISLKNEPPSRAFWLGFMAGLIHYLTLIYWIVVAIGHYGNLNPFLSAVILFLLCLYLALYLGLFSIFSACAEKSRFSLFFIASFWVALEYARAHLLTGFPWCLLGYTQFRHLHMIQIADLCGVYGLSFLIVIVNILIVHVFFRRHNRVLGLHKWEFLFTILMVGLTVTYGHFRLTQGQKEKSHFPHVNSVIIQGNIDQSVKWSPAYQAKTMMTYQRLSHSTHRFRPGLIVWPETSLPFFFQNSKVYQQKVYAIAKKSGALLVFGSPAYKTIDGNTKYYNRAYLVAPNDEPPQYYDKVHLLPFGEYVPLKNLLFFVSRLVPAAGDFDAGERIAPLKHGKLSMGILICYEAIFPGLARAHALAGANILINITNDAWFGMTSAPHQHLVMAAFRTVENRIPMIRAANTGLSAFIGVYGNIIDQSAPFTTEVLKATLDIPKSPLTFYTRFGDIFAFVAIVISLIGIASFIFTRRKL